jgi:hypothetical protein
VNFAFCVSSRRGCLALCRDPPQILTNQLVYVSYPKRDGDRFTLAVARGRLSGAKLTDVQEIFVADAWETGGNLAGRVFSDPTGCSR